MRAENSLNSIKDTYDRYNDLCSELTGEIKAKQSQIIELDREIKRYQDIISKIKEEVII